LRNKKKRKEKEKEMKKRKKKKKKKYKGSEVLIAASLTIRGTCDVMLWDPGQYLPKCRKTLPGPLC
jgi:hypothetical protein